MKSISFAILFSTLLGILVYTNPKNSDFGNFIKMQIADGSARHGPIERVVTGLFGGLAAHALEENVRRRDYVIFSTYELQFGTADLRIIGLLNNFFVVAEPYKDLLFSKSGSPSLANRISQSNSTTLPNTQHQSVIFHPSHVTQWPPIEIEALNLKLPFQVIRELDPERFKILLGDNFQSYADHLDVASPIQRHGNFLVGTGCFAHSCNNKLGAFFLDSITGQLYAAQIDDETVNIFGIAKQSDIPAIMRDWLEDPHKMHARMNTTAHVQEDGDYRISEGLSLASVTKIAVNMYFFAHGQLPKDNSEAEIAPPDDISDKSVKSVTVRNGVIIVQFVGRDIDLKTIEITPNEDNGRLQWSCKEGGTLQQDLRPISCRH